MVLHPQYWDTSVFLLYQMLAMPLIVGGAPPQSPAKAFAYSMGVALQCKSNQCTGYTIVVITKITISIIANSYQHVFI